MQLTHLRQAASKCVTLPWAVPSNNTVSALIKAPLKINYDPREAPSLERIKFLWGPGGALFREAPSN